MNALIDANVLVSAVLPERSPSAGAVHQLLRIVAERRFTLRLAAESVDEARGTLTTKPWFVKNITPDRIERIIHRLQTLAIMLPSLAYTPPRRCRDRKDDYLLEQAIRFRADILVTGDEDLLAIDGTIEGLRVLKPRALPDELTGGAT